ncbi:unnamed protein product, partial [Mesorhabditis spiculigera]
MADEDPILDGFPISQLRVVDLREHLEKRGLDKKGNKKELADRLKEFILANESSAATPVEAEPNVAPAATATAAGEHRKSKSPEKSPSKSASGSPGKGNPLLAMYMAKQQEMIAEAEAAKRKSVDSGEASKETDDPAAGDAEKTVISPVKSQQPSQAADDDDVKEDEPEPEVKKGRGRPSNSRGRKASESQSPTRRSSRGRGRPPKSTGSQMSLELDEDEPTVDAQQPVINKTAVTPEPEMAEKEPEVAEKEHEKEPSPPVVEQPKDVAVEEKKKPEEKPEQQHKPADDGVEQPEPTVKSTPEKNTNGNQESPVSNKQSPAKQPSPEPEVEPEQTKQQPNEDKEEGAPEESDEQHTVFTQVSTSATKSPPRDENGQEELLDYGDDDDEAEAKGAEQNKREALKEKPHQQHNQRQHSSSKPKEELPVDTSSMWLPEKDGFKRVKEPSPCRNPVSTYVHIRGLTRPFTQHQLNALISNNGTIDKFWIDKIKSNCVVQLATVEEAQRVRRALHNVVWPETNPKSLSVQYTTKEQYERYSAGLAPVTETRSTDRERPVTSLKRDPEPISSTPSASTRNIKEGRQTLKITVETNVRDNERTAVRHVERAREKERERDRDAERDSTRRKRSATPPHRRDDVKRDRRERSRSRQRVDEPQAKTLEELFKKTAAQPAIYYLPLTDEQAAKRAEEKAIVEKARQEERERREKERASRRKSRSPRRRRTEEERRAPVIHEHDVARQPSDEDELMAGSYLICATLAIVFLLLLVFLEAWTGCGYGLYMGYYRLTVTVQPPLITPGIHHIQLVVVVKNGDMTHRCTTSANFSGLDERRAGQGRLQRMQSFLDWYTQWAPPGNDSLYCRPEDEPEWSTLPSVYNTLERICLGATPKLVAFVVCELLVKILIFRRASRWLKPVQLLKLVMILISFVADLYFKLVTDALTVATVVASVIVATIDWLLLLDREAKIARQVYELLMARRRFFLLQLGVSEAYLKKEVNTPKYPGLDVGWFGRTPVPAGMCIRTRVVRRQENAQEKATSQFRHLWSLATRSTPPTRAFIDGSDDKMMRLYGYDAFSVQMALHTFFGHGTDKLIKNDASPGLVEATNKMSDFSTAKPNFYDQYEHYESVFRAIAKAYEECRAGAISLLLSCEAEVYRICGYDSALADKIKYVIWLTEIRAGLMALESYNVDQKKWGQADCHARYVLTRVCLEAGQGFVTIESLTNPDGKPDLKFKLDRTKIDSVGKPAVREFLIKLQHYKSTADFTGGKELFDHYGKIREIELGWRDVCIARWNLRLVFSATECPSSLEQLIDTRRAAWHLESQQEPWYLNVKKWLFEYGPKPRTRILLANTLMCESISKMCPSL